MQLFYAKARPKANPKDAVLRLRETLSMLEKREAFLQNKIDSELKTAKLNAGTNKRGKSSPCIDINPIALPSMHAFTVFIFTLLYSLLRSLLFCVEQPVYF